jgi:hypothetical protein
MLWPDLLRSNGGAMTIAPQIDAGLQAQLERARQVQLRLLPGRRCCLSDWDVAFSCESAGFVSGDYVDFESWMSSLRWILPRLISSSQSAITQRIRPVLCGLGSP